MGVLTRYVLQRPEVDLRMVEIDTESVDYLLLHFPQVNGKLIEADFLKLKLENFFKVFNSLFFGNVFEFIRIEIIS
jgi:16S rRNA (adenine1518-N6/adenine1519-N6)-dimethyltransferase